MDDLNVLKNISQVMEQCKSTSYHFMLRVRKIVDEVRLDCEQELKDIQRIDDSKSSEV